jgi:hypothetical protein
MVKKWGVHLLMNINWIEHAKDSMAWMTQNQLAELFDTSKQNIS